MIVGERGVVVPEPNFRVVLARGGPSAALLPRLCDDIVWDIFSAYDREQQARPTHLGAHMLDTLRAELARRHHPTESEQICSRCLCAFSEHDEVFQTCPDDDRFRAVTRER